MLSLFVFSSGLVLVAVLYLKFPDLQKEFWSGVFIEFNGLLFDVVVFGVLIAGFLRFSGRRQEITRQQEIIDDYKKWNHEEAKFRIAGAIRRINRLGKTAIDFGGIELRAFSFKIQDIDSIKGSTFYDGTWGEMSSRENVLLENIDFSYMNCEDVVFSKFNPFVGTPIDAKFAVIKDCQFSECNLVGAKFIGAHLEWTTKFPDELGVWHDLPEGPAFEQIHYSPFFHADLKGASFMDSRFTNGDFREVENIFQCDFKGATGLDGCRFDDEDIKRAVLKMAQENGNDGSGQGN